MELPEKVYLAAPASMQSSERQFTSSPAELFWRTINTFLALRDEARVRERPESQAATQSSHSQTLIQRQAPPDAGSVLI